MTTPPTNRVRVHDVLRAANKRAGVDLSTPCRKLPIVRMRWAAMKAARDLTGASFPLIGQIFGGMDHTSIMYGVQRADPLLAKAIGDDALLAGAPLFDRITEAA